MMKSSQKILPALLVIGVVAVASFGLFNVVQSFTGGAPKVLVEGDLLWSEAQGESLGGTIFNREISFDNGIAVDGTTIVDGSGLLTLTQEANLDTLVHGGDYTTISSGSETLSAAQVCDSSVLEFTSTASSTTVTLPTGASLISDCLPATGDQKYLYFNAPADDETTTLATGSTMNLLVASGSSADLTFVGDASARLHLINFDGTNVDVVVEHLTDAD